MRERLPLDRQVMELLIGGELEELVVSNNPYALCNEIILILCICSLYALLVLSSAESDGMTMSRELEEHIVK